MDYTCCGVEYLTVISVTHPARLQGALPRPAHRYRYSLGCPGAGLALHGPHLNTSKTSLQQSCDDDGGPGGIVSDLCISAGVYILAGRPGPGAVRGSGMVGQARLTKTISSFILHNRDLRGDSLFTRCRDIRDTRTLFIATIVIHTPSNASHTPPT